LINLREAHPYKVETRIVGLDGKVLNDQTNQVEAAANARTPVGKPELEKLANDHTILIALRVTDTNGTPVSDNLYWWSKQESSLRELDALADVRLKASATLAASPGERQATIKLENTGTVPALLVKLTLKDAATDARILPAYYSENYVSLLPGDSRTVTIAFPAGESRPKIALRGWNLEKETIAVR
jgi:uncharacterized membrane protein